MPISRGSSSSSAGGRSSQSRPRDAGITAEDRGLVEAVRKWQTRLLQMDRRNALLYFAPGRKSVPIVSIGPDKLVRRLEVARRGLAFLYAERRQVRREVPPDSPTLPEAEDVEAINVRPGDLDTDLNPLELQRRLLSLRNKDREWEEEQGINVLFLAIGFLQWVDEECDVVRSPILLVPCDLERDSPRDPFRLVLDESDAAAVNPTLRHKLSAMAGIDLPEVGEDSPTAYLEVVRRLTAARKDWAVESSIVLTTFPFSKLAMWEDLERMWRNGLEHPLVRRLAGDSTAEVPAPVVELRPIPSDPVHLVGGRMDDLLEIRDQHTILDADFSQLRAIHAARSGKNLVIHGPPGTGKSQTIANIIATLLADGRRVLFVSEKTAALDVVKRRLTEVGLGTFCLDLHSERGKKASVYAQLREALDQTRVEAKDFPFDVLSDRRKELNAVVRALHDVRQPLGLSVFEIHGRLVDLHDAPMIEEVPVRDIARLDRQRLRTIQESAEQLARRSREFREHHTSRWRPLAIQSQSPRLRDRIREDMLALRAATRELAESLQSAVGMLGLLPTEVPEAARHCIDLLRHLETAPGRIPTAWLLAGDLQIVRGTLLELRQLMYERRQTISRLQRNFSETPHIADPHVLLAHVRSIAAQGERWQELAGDSWSTHLLANPAARVAEYSGLRDALNAFRQSGSALASFLGAAETCDSKAASDGLMDLATRIIAVSPVSEAWDSIAGLDRIRAEAASGQAHLENVIAAETALAETFTEDIIEQVSQEMLVRYRTDYRSFWHRMRRQFRRDQRTVGGCLRRPGRLTVEVATDAVALALSVRRLRAQWEEISSRLGVVLGIRFSGRSTDWKRVNSDLDICASIFQDAVQQIEVVRRLLTDPLTPVALKPVLDNVRRCWVGLLNAARSLTPTPDCADVESLETLTSSSDAYATAASTVDRVLSSIPDFSFRPADVDALVEILAALVHLQAVERDAERRAPDLASTLGTWFENWDTDVEAVERAIAWATTLMTISRKPMNAALRQHALAPMAPLVYAQEREQLMVRYSRFQATTAAISERFDVGRTAWRSWNAAPLTAVESWCTELEMHADEAPDWIEYRSAATRLDEAIGAHVTDALRRAVDDPVLVPRIVLRHVYLEWLDHVYTKVPTLRFSPRDHESLRRTFRDLDRQFVLAARARVRERCLSAYPDDQITPAGRGQLGLLFHELSKRRRQLPVRRLSMVVPVVLQALKPCFMMSPLAVSQYLPEDTATGGGLAFDAVIFDEASQVYPEDAVPAISRGQQVIVVGDRQQLPPSSFFRRELDDEIDDDTDEPPQNSDRLEGTESILDVMVGMRGSGVDEVYLEVHYRSRHDDLIRYSNHYFYDDRLVTFPTADPARPELGVRAVYLPDGRFDAGATRTNRAEAESVVDLVFTLMESRPRAESIGVVALSRAQADLIQSLLDSRRLLDRRFDANFADTAVERFFVKNLENVQGDERDHIILSVAYGPTVATGSVPNRFGPLNTEGGQRRLNVAVSRARKSMTVVHSLRPEDIHSETVGARLLRRYLEFARAPRVAFEKHSPGHRPNVPESPFEESVGRALEQRGFRIQRQVGCARYWIDIAVLSEDGSSFDLGIECDGATYHSSPTARDRDWLRQEILERLGWRIHRVWSTAWLRNPASQIEALENAIREARDSRRNLPTQSRQAIESVAIATDSDAAKWTQTRAAPSRDGTESASNLSFEPYRVADLTGSGRQADLRSEGPLRLQKLVVDVVTVEAPVHVDLVIERIRARYGLQRAGRLVRESVSGGIKTALSSGRVAWLEKSPKSRSDGAFLIVDATAPVRPRGASPTGAIRAIHHVSDTEIEAGLLVVIRAMFGASRSDAIVATARAFGYSRLGENVESRIKKAVARLSAKGVLIAQQDSLIVRE